MEQSSPFAQRLKSIAARRKLHELILSTRLDLEQEKLRAQRLKRKSLREQWLMEGTLASPDDRDPLSPLREAETRIEELQQSLNSLQIQMQQLDNVETWKVRQETPSEEPVRDVGGVNQSPEGPEKVDTTALTSSEGRSGGESTLVSAPASPQRPPSAEAKETLQNGEMQDGDPLGNECGPEEAQVKAIPMAEGKGDHRPHQGGSKAANVAGQNLDPGKAPASHQRKLAMEEMVIRDHLGQEVGCMDAVGQNQSSLGKEEELEDHTDLGDSCDRGSQRGSVDGVSDQKEALGEGQLDHELGNRGGPDGQSPTYKDHASPSSFLQNENGYPKGQEDRPLEMGSPAKEAGGTEVGKEEVSERSAQEVPALALATGDAPPTESVKPSGGNQMETPVWQELGATEDGQGWAEFPHRSQVHAQTLVDQVFPPPPEVEPLMLEVIPSSWHETKETIGQQGEEPTGKEVAGSLADTIPSFTSQLPSLPDHIVPLQDATISVSEPSPLVPEDQKPVPPETKVPPRPDSDVFLPDQIPLFVDDPGESPVALQDEIPQALQDTESTSPAGENPTSSPQEADGALPDETPSHDSPHLLAEEESAPDQGLPTLGELLTPSLLGQTPSFQEAAKSPSDPPEGRSLVAEQTPSSDKAQSHILQDESLGHGALPLSGQETLQPLLNETEAVGNRDVKDSGDASMDSVGVGETTDLPESLCSEQQPLLKEATASGAPLNVSVRDPQLQAGILKPQVATSKQAPNSGSRIPANTASSHPPQAELPHQGEDQEAGSSKQKPKSCQCCLLM
ncbi:UNVERIFIED_CONTAM: hypothetical protein K2H54_053059 [Gekko kuhli]